MCQLFLELLFTITRINRLLLKQSRQKYKSYLIGNYFNIKLTLKFIVGGVPALC